MIKKSAFFTGILIGVFSFISCQQTKSTSLKVMSYNIRHGEGLDTILDLSRAANLIKAQSPHFVGLQEIDHYCTRTDSVNQTQYLSERTNLTGTFGKFMDFQNGAYGMATLTALPIISSRVLELPKAKYEPRSAIVQIIQVEEKAVVIANVHFDWIGGEEGSQNRLKQAKALVHHLDAIGEATIILGDFNCTPNSPTMAYFKEQGFVFAEKGADNLSFQIGKKVEIDHIIYRSSEDLKLSLKFVSLLEAPITSDHRPLVAELLMTND